MSNVKPGDFGEVIYCTVRKNLRRQCLVLGEAVARTDHEFAQKVRWGLIWRCEALEPFFARLADGRQEWVKAGSAINVADAHLKRIEPPADTEEVFRDRPIDDQEFADQLNRRIKELL